LLQCLVILRDVVSGESFFDCYSAQSFFNCYSAQSFLFDTAFSHSSLL
jgi:hypothetical protein